MENRKNTICRFCPSSSSFLAFARSVILIVNDLDYRTLNLFTSRKSPREDELKDVLVNHRCRCSPLEEKLTYYQMNTRYHYESSWKKERRRRRIQSYSTSLLPYLLKIQIKHIYQGTREKLLEMTIDLIKVI